MTRMAGWAPLAGVRIAEMSDGIATSYCGRLLRDAGADVAQPVPGAPTPLQRYLDHGKRVAGPDAAQGADVVVGALDAAAVDRLRRADPRCVVVSVTPFGLTGPWAGRPANDFTLQAWGGSVARRGDAERGPLAAGGDLTYWSAGAVAAVAAMGALLGRERTGRGDHVDVSLLETATLVFNGFMAVAGQFAPDGGNRADPWVPQPYTEVPSVVRAADGWVGFATNSAAQFRAFAELVGHPDWSTHPEYARADRRGHHASVLVPLIEEWAGQHSVASVVELARERHIPVAPVGNGRDTPHFDHLVARRSYAYRDGVLWPGVPYRVQPAAGPARGREAPDGRAALAGLRVFDLTSYWAGPCASQVLGWLGADVVKVESTRRPDGTRMGSAYATDGDRPWEKAPLFHGVNTGKRGVTIDLSRPAGLALGKALLGRCDVLVENFAPRVVEKFGLLPGPGERPDLIVARMPAWGLTGPWREQPGFAQNMEQATGLAYVTGRPDGPPVVPRGVCDPLGGLHAAFAVLTAVWRRRATGLGARIEVPLVDAALAVTAGQVADYSACGLLARRLGNRAQDAAPQGVYPFPDGGFAAVSVEDDAQWRALVGVLGEEGAGDWSDARTRHREQDAIDVWLSDRLWKADREAVVEALCAAGVPAALVMPAERVGDNVQLQARGFFADVEHPVAGRVSVPLFPARWAGGAAPAHGGPAPLLGQHNAEVFGELLGLSDARLAQLERDGVIGTRPAVG